ncbi:Opacity protein and related surface antigens (plasmid) [Legionella adelaidensis]|uniref:Opacity protein and related surface antigens n=1 Tax=Legionella adelaidensis TaxID=45056 RepID=A0A0W0R0T9_9GAMM|nr:outer membrane beta-barrel protein [Legionella adelaidensis]KTC64720.1 hypothetical protein Lade_2014 [Legionella adelaidensis]VEH82853.1 Opacity protein and related surface antigens [Legionella adelaidensis]
MKRQFILFFLLFFFSHFTYSNTPENITSDKRFVLGLDLGLTAKEQLVKSTRFPLGYSTFIYTPSKNNPARYGVSLGRIFKLNSSNNLVIGLGYHQFNSFNVSGTLQQGISPPFFNANYQYTVQLSQLLAEAKVQHQWSPRWYPYLTAGVGGGFNKARQFSTTVPSYLTVTPAFSHHTDSSLSYMLGAGIDTVLLPNVTFGLGYVFSDLGHVGLDSGSILGGTVPNYLSQSHFYTNTFLAQLSWYF